MILYAQALHSGDQRQESIPLILRARGLVREVLGPAHPLNVKCTVLLASMRYRNREQNEAFRLADEAFLAARNSPDIDEADLFTAMHFVGRARAFQKNGCFEDGEKLITQFVNLSRERHGDDHLLTARAKHNLAAFYYDSRKKLDEAEQLYLDALQTHRRILGEDHDKTVMTRENLALLYEVLQRPADLLNQYLALLQSRPLKIRALNMMPDLLARVPLPAVLDRSDTAAWRMTTNAPATNWTETDFDPVGWLQSLQPDATEAWFRAEFELSTTPAHPLVFWINGSGNFELFINGVRAVKQFGSARGEFQFAVSTPESTTSLRPGRNIIALHATGLRPPAALAIAVYRSP